MMDGRAKADDRRALEVAREERGDADAGCGYVSFGLTLYFFPAQREQPDSRQDDHRVRE